MAHLMGMRATDSWRFNLSNAGVSVLREHEYLPSRWQLHLFNDTARLDG